MYRSVVLFFVFFITPALLPASGSEQTEASAPASDTPGPLVEAWLKFHSEELCQGIDAVFEFKNQGMTVTGSVEDENSYEKFLKLIAPLQARYPIELNATHQKEKEKEKKDDDADKDPPPSLWQNYELRSYLGDPFARGMQRANFEDRMRLYLPPPDEMLRQQLLIYAQQTLDWNRKIERYARELPALLRVAYDPQAAPELQSQAREVARRHARDLDRYIGKLNSNLERAFPTANRTKGEQGELQGFGAANDLIDRAERISTVARRVARRVHEFIHPEHYTVSLEELRQPSLLESLKMLRKMGTEFGKSLPKS